MCISIYVYINTSICVFKRMCIYIYIHMISIYHITFLQVTYNSYMGVSKNCFFTPKSSVFPYKPSILGKTHHFWKHPYLSPILPRVASSGRTQVMPLLRPRCKSWSNGEAFFEPRKKPSDTLPKFNIAPEKLPSQ